MLDFDLKYFEEETRDGFTIPAFMKHAWASQLELLNKVDIICEENNIPYFADYGTLLGTIRHKGYIPWDDDIDLCMMRHDLERFCEVVDNYDGILIHTCYNAPDHGFHAARVMNSTMFTVERDVYKEYHGFPFPVGLDIFTLDYVPREKEFEKEQIDALKVCSTAFHSKEWLDKHTPVDKEYVQQFAEYKTAVKWLEKNCGMEFSDENPSQQEILILNEEIGGLYGDEESDYITQFACLCVGWDYYIPKDAYSSSIRMPFENTTVPVPVGYDLLLRKKYGDEYMTPIQADSGHDYPFYNTFIRAIFDERKHKTFEGACEYIENISSRFYIKFRQKTKNPILDIEDNYFKEEVIDGQKVTEEQKRKLAAECEVLEEFKRLCEVTNTTYFAIDSTLESATSASGKVFDDTSLHVAIKREELNDFLIMLGQELGPWFNYSCIYSSEKHEDMRIFIWSDSYMCDEEEFRTRFHGYGENALIDISIIDKVSPDTSRDEVRKMLIENLITTSKSMPSEPPYSDEIFGIVDEWRRIAQVSVNTDLNLRREFLRAADNIGGAVADDGVTQVRITASLQDGVDKVYNISDFDEAIEKNFFVTTINVPSGYKSII